MTSRAPRRVYKTRRTAGSVSVDLLCCVRERTSKRRNGPHSAALKLFSSSFCHPRSISLQTDRRQIACFSSFEKPREEPPPASKMSLSQCRQNYHAESEAGVNRQVNMELYASYCYQSMVSLFVCLSACLSVCLLVCLSACQVNMELYASYSCQSMVSVFVCLSACLSVCLSGQHGAVCFLLLPVYGQSVCLSACLFVCLPIVCFAVVSLPVCLSVRLSVGLSVRSVACVFFF